MVDQDQVLQAKEATEMRRKSKKNPVKVYSKEEIAAINAERNK